MLPFAIYLITALLTGFHVYSLLSLAVYGVPATLLEPASLVGSVWLLAAAYVSLFRARVGAKIALPSSLLAWCFYAPALLGTMRAGKIGQISGAAVLPYLAVMFLAVSTAYSAFVSFAPSLPRRRRWIFPEQAASRTRMVLAALSVVVIAASGIWMGVTAHGARRISSRFLIPSGYVGWVRVEFGMSGSAPLATQGNQFILRIPSDGLLTTSSPERYGWGKDQYFYSSASGLHELPAAGPSDKRLIWGQVNGEDHTASRVRDYEEFFVGSEPQFRQQAGNMRIGPISAAPNPH
jgi:hypothetical protein